MHEGFMWNCQPAPSGNEILSDVQDRDWHRYRMMQLRLGDLQIWSGSQVLG